MKLSNENINDVIKKIKNFFESLNISDADKIKICILLEESLLRFQEKFGENHEFNFITKKWFGTPKILIKVKGKPYNPIEDNSEENIFPESVMRNLLNYEKARTIYSYEDGYNEISAFSYKERKPIKIPGGSTTISILLAIFAALVFGKIFSPHTQNIFVSDILDPILQTLFGALVAVTVPLFLFRLSRAFAILKMFRC